MRSLTLWKYSWIPHGRSQKAYYFIHKEKQGSSFEKLIMAKHLLAVLPSCDQRIEIRQPYHAYQFSDINWKFSGTDRRNVIFGAISKERLQYDKWSCFLCGDCCHFTNSFDATGSQVNIPSNKILSSNSRSLRLDCFVSNMSAGKYLFIILMSKSLLMTE